MGAHKNAALTVRQREQIHQATREGTASRRHLATRYGVSLTTVQRWAPRPDGHNRPLGRPVGTGTPEPAYEQAVLVERIREPTHRPVRIAHELRPRFACAHRGTVLALLQAHGLTRVVLTDNHMIFTMKYTAHPQRRTAFGRQCQVLGIAHALIAKGKPWRNGFIERSNRTDKAELFTRRHFVDNEERRYYLHLWEMEYNHDWPHQGINNQTPKQRCAQIHPVFATCCIPI